MDSALTRPSEVPGTSDGLSLLMDCQLAISETDWTDSYRL